MAETTYPGVFANEIDQTGPTPASPDGVPAGVVGTAARGPAFVPVTVPNFSQFIAKFGDTKGKYFGPMAVKEWLANAGAGTFVRVLGTGDGTARATSNDAATAPVTWAGAVTRAGFIVGDQVIQANGALGENPYTPAAPAGPLVPAGVLGRTYMLGCFMSASQYPDQNSSLWGEAGLTNWTTGSVPIVRGILLAPSGVVLTLSSALNPNNEPTVGVRPFAGTSSMQYDRTVPGSPAAANLGGGRIGRVLKGNDGNADQFTMLLNGFVNGSMPAKISASLNPSQGNYFPNVFNTNPLKIEEEGHYLYTHYDIFSTVAEITGAGSRIGAQATPFVPGRIIGRSVAFLLTSSVYPNNEGTAASVSSVGVPNLEGFSDRYRHAVSSYLVSQDFGDGAQNLFRFHALSDGTGGDTRKAADLLTPQKDLPPDRIKVSISNIQPSKETASGFEYGSFTVKIRDLQDNDVNPAVHETYNNCNLDPASDNYIGRKIGNTNTYFDFDKTASAQKLVVEGSFPNVSNLVRVEITPEVDRGAVGMSPTALPIGFRGQYHLVTSGSGPILMFTGSSATVTSVNYGVTQDTMQTVNQPPVPFRRAIKVGELSDVSADDVKSEYHWGVQTSQIQLQNNPNNNDAVFNSGMYGFVKYFPRHLTTLTNWLVGDNEGTADVGGTILDADRFNNNFFTLERVQVLTASSGLPDAAQWAAARYRRNGVSSNLTDSDSAIHAGKFIDPNTDFADSTARTHLKFSVIMNGGFDGVNIFDSGKAGLTDNAVRREFDNINQGGVSGPTVVAYRKAVDILAEKSDVDIQLLAIPGIRHPVVTDYTIDAVEDRFDAMYIMDIEQQDVEGNFITGSNVNVSVANTRNRFSDRNLDTSFAAAYFPDVIVQTAPGASRATSNPLAGGVSSTPHSSVQVPASVSVLGAFALNDRVGFPWFAPAGFTRGALNTAISLATNLQTSDLGGLYENDINPIVSEPAVSTTGPAGNFVLQIRGQKTLLQAQSALDRVNVRRLLIEVRRRVKKVADNLLFEPNREETLASFQAAVQPIMNQIQQQQGISRFRVVIDSSTTTQADVENNTVRGKIFLQPTRSVEFISLDFVVTNTINDDAL
jgi:hypothetical protein